MKTLKLWISKHEWMSRGIISYFVLWSISAMFKGNQTDYIVSNSIFALFLFVVIYLILKKAADFHLRRAGNISSSVLGFFYSATLLFGRNIVMEDTLYINQIGSWIRVLGGTILFSACVRYLFFQLPLWMEKWKEIRFLSWLDTVKHPFLVDWILIFVAWIPLWILCFPGIYVIDSSWQIKWYQEGTLYTHHPLLHTLFLGWCVNDFPTPELGMMFYSLVQMLTLSFAFAFVCDFLRKLKQPQVVRRIVLFWFMFFTPNALMSFSATKDVFFTASFVVFLVLMARGIQDNQLLKNWKWIGGMLVSGFLVLALRSQSRYVLILTLLVGVVIWRKQLRRTMTLLFVGILVLFQIYNGPVTKALGGLPYDSIREMMSVPLMQMSRALIYSPDQLDKQLQEEIKSYIPTYEAYSMGPAISDDLKMHFNLEKFKENPLSFISLWVETGLRCPVNYVDAFCRLNVAAWYPDMYANDPGAYHPYFQLHSMPPEDYDWVPIHRMTPEIFQPIYNQLNRLIGNAEYQKIPLLGILFSAGASIWTLWFFFAYACSKKYWKLFPVFSVPVFMWLTILVAPIVVYRYMYPIMACLPVLWGMLFKTQKDEEANRQ